jgi:hypothetical protein
MPPMFQKQIMLVGPGGQKRPATVSCFRKDWIEKKFSRRECRIELHADGFDLQSAAWDFFEAFCGIRDQLAAHGFFPLCYGASRSVYPSGMCRDMGAGLIAYRLQGRRVRKGDEVNIFDTGPDVEVATVAAQRAFFDERLKETREHSAQDRIAPRTPRINQ